MNNQELFERIENMPYESGILMDFVKINRGWLLKTIKQLEPEKVTIPQCAHEYIQKAKECSWDLQDLLKYISDEDIKELQRWFYHECNQETLAKAWIYGYEVEKEKRYLVKLKNIDTNSAYLKHQLQNNHWYWGSLTECGAFSPYHTKKELEAAGFGWVFDCEGVEIEELEDE